MSLFCDLSSELSQKGQPSVQEFSYQIFSNIFQSKDALPLNTDQFVFKLTDHQDKVLNGITHWTCTHQAPQFIVRVTFQFKSIKKVIQKRLVDTLNKQFKFTKLLYQKPKLTSIFKFCATSQTNYSQIFQIQITQVISYLSQIVQRTKILEKQHQKLEPFIELYSMRECFEFNRSSRQKSSKVSLKFKRNKVVTDVLKLLAQGQTTLNKLDSMFIDGEIRKFDELKGKILLHLESISKNSDKVFDQSILTSIDIMKVQEEKQLIFPNHKVEDQLSFLSKAKYTFRKEITIHKQSTLESLSNEVFEEYLIKKTKSAKGADQFENETKLLTFLKSCFHPYIAEYYCKLEQVPFKSESLYVMHYNESLGGFRQKISTDKKIEMAYHIAKVLTFLSYRKICHRDLKMDNIMVDNSLNPKVIDWGSVCPMYGPQNISGGLKVKSQILYSTEGYFQRYFEDVFYEPFGKNYTRQQIEKGEFFDVYSFGFILEKVFALREIEDCSWVECQMEYVSKKCREKNPADRLSAIELEIYLGMLLKKLKKLQKSGLSSHPTIEASVFSKD